MPSVILANIPDLAESEKEKKRKKRKEKVSGTFLDTVLVYW